MHYALVFSTSKVKTKSRTASAWLKSFHNSLTFLQPQTNGMWLAPGTAAEIHCKLTNKQKYPDIVHSQAFTALRLQASHARIDVNLIPRKNRRKAILIADMDKTVITSESINELAKAAGLDKQIFQITRRAMTGKIDFEAALIERAAILAGKPKSLIDKIAADSCLTSGACTLVQTMRANGAFCYLISGGFDAVAKRVAAKCGFHGHHANHLNHNGKIITGTVKKPILDSYAKVRYLFHYCALHKVNLCATASIGDGANDLGMLDKANFGVAFNGKPILRKKVALQINHTDLTGLLFLQGYTFDQFVCD